VKQMNPGSRLSSVILVTHLSLSTFAPAAVLGLQAAASA